MLSFKWIFSVLPLVAALCERDGEITPCCSPLYCRGEILREVELAQPFDDSKTYVDLPTIRPLDEVVAAFNELQKPITNNSALTEFLTTYFGEAGSELTELPDDQLETNPEFLDSVQSEDVRDFLSQVIDIWPDLTREYVGGGNCSGCVSSLLPLRRPFVVAGGRFREPYYWDSFWILEGLLRTQGSFTQIAHNIIENFLDIIEEYGFMPNGARQYYLNRSQPPLLTQMVRIYIEYTNDTSILDRALPILEQEYDFFMTNRTVDVEADGATYTLNHYAVLNTQPRPESYLEDYQTVTNSSYYAESGIIYPEGTALTEEQQARAYANLASGAESGWDYSTRWLRNPSDAINDNYFPLRTLNVIETVPVDLNSILYANEIAIASFLERQGNSTGASAWRQLATQRQEAMTALFWDPEQWAYFDWNMTSGSRNVYTLADEDAVASETEGAPEGYQTVFGAHQYYPFWLGAAPNFLKNNPYAVQQAYVKVADQLARKPGAIPTTNLVSGEQWDEPNVWPPHQYIIMAGALNTPPTFGEDDPSYMWLQEIAYNVSQRYLDSAFCTWRVTGGSTPNFPKLEGIPDDVNGVIFEKYADNAINAAGAGGEYEVVEGFGWSNGVLIWAGDQFGDQLQTPECGDISAADIITETRRKKRSAMLISKRDKQWIKSFK